MLEAFHIMRLLITSDSISSHLVLVHGLLNQQKPPSSSSSSYSHYTYDVFLSFRYSKKLHSTSLHSFDPIWNPHIQA
ncbi:hypothetical protein HanPSC8_Chr16g0724951 [Helianthus annuus]|nr:hypothetical protein HanIR_Chr16g0822021 [Helianthus annuus]KAJ0821842.1 hypothetical protein HanPSC8_Chr16g0724951 [Helianthus annuus]